MMSKKEMTYKEKEDQKKFREKIICGLMITAGVGCLVAGIFIPLLLIPAAALLSGGVALMGNIVHENDRVAINQPTINTFNTYESSDSETTPVEKKRAIFKLSSKENPMFFAFKSTKLFKQRKPEEPEEEKTKSLYDQLEPDMQRKIEKLNDILLTLDTSLIDKLSRQHRPNADRQSLEKI